MIQDDDDPTTENDKREKFVVRMPEGMRARIRAAKERSGRSMNSEIVHYMESGLEDLDLISLARSIKNIEADIAEIKRTLKGE